MIKKIIALIVCVSIGGAVAAPSTKTICRDVKQKNGRVVKQCKTIKVHKMYQGTKVPTSTPAKKPVTKKK